MRVRKEVRARVREPVVGLVLGELAQAKRAREVDHAGAGLGEDARREIDGDLGARREEDEVGARGEAQRGGVRLEAQGAERPGGRVQRLPDGLPPALVGGAKNQLDRAVRREDRSEDAAGVTGGSDDADAEGHGLSVRR